MSLIDESYRLADAVAADPGLQERLNADPAGTLEALGLTALHQELQEISEIAVHQLEAAGDVSFDELTAKLAENGAPRWMTESIEDMNPDTEVAGQTTPAILAATGRIALEAARRSSAYCLSLLTSQIRHLDCPWRNHC